MFFSGCERRVHNYAIKCALDGAFTPRKKIARYDLHVGKDLQLSAQQTGCGAININAGHSKLRIRFKKWPH
jgi:hypothetical protein